MTSQLIVYNLALGHLEQRPLASLSEASEPRRTLDAYWAHCVAYCQEQGLWAFMVRVVQQDASTTVIPGGSWNSNDAPASPAQPVGFEYAFPLPVDWVRTVVVSTSPTLEPPLTQYSEEAGYLFANFTPLYYSYVSKDPLYGMNLGAWPEVFTEFCSITLARMACKRITGSTDLCNGPDGLKAMEKHARIDARSKDAMNLPPGFAPMSTWVRSRRGFMTGNWDDGPLPSGGF
jgi:hypothetical protein